MRAFLGLAFVLAVTLSGCSGGDGKTSTSDGSTTIDPLTTASTGPTEKNAPPTGTVSTSVPSGPTPLNVTFTLTATDPDGDSMAWTLDVDGDGSPDTRQDKPATFPATFTHLYVEPGSFNITYTLSDGKEIVEYNASIEVTGNIASQSVTGGWQASSVGCPGPYDTWVFGTPGNGVGWKEFDVDAATVGRPYHLEFESDAPATVGSVEFYDADGASVGGMFDTAPFDDVVPEGSIHGMISDCGGANFTFTYQTK